MRKTARMPDSDLPKYCIAQVVNTVLLAAFLVAAHAAAADEPETWALRGAKVYVAPDRAPIVDGVVVI